MTERLERSLIGALDSIAADTSVRDFHRAFSCIEDCVAQESPELREAMTRAKAALLRRMLTDLTGDLNAVKHLDTYSEPSDVPAPATHTPSQWRH